MTKKVFDMEVRKELKDTKDIMETAVSDLMNVTVSREQLIKENQELKEKVKHLEELLLNVPTSGIAELKTHEEDIVRVELKRMFDAHVLNNIPLVDRDDIKKLKTLVECLSIIKNSSVPKKAKEKEMSVDEALAIVKNEVNR